MFFHSSLSTIGKLLAGGIGADFSKKCSLSRITEAKNMINAIIELGEAAVMNLVRRYASQLEVPECLNIDYVCRACCENPVLAPNINANKRKNRLSPEECVEQWVKKFLHSYEERISVRTSNLPSTIPDQAVSIILSAGLHCHSMDSICQIMYAHRLGMSAENILGLLLEEFLFSVLSPKGWAFAWGETIRSVDFCDKNGFLLQIKNRSNSENSSSSQIRIGKPISKWHRVNALNGQYEWEKLQDIVGHELKEQLNEVQFQSFIIDVLGKNPGALAIEEKNPWLSIVRK